MPYTYFGTCRVEVTAPYLIKTYTQTVFYAPFFSILAGGGILVSVLSLVFFGKWLRSRWDRIPLFAGPAVLLLVLYFPVLEDHYLIRYPLLLISGPFLAFPFWSLSLRVLKVTNWFFSLLTGIVLSTGILLFSVSNMMEISSISMGEIVMAGMVSGAIFFPAFLYAFFSARNRLILRWVVPFLLGLFFVRLIPGIGSHEKIIFLGFLLLLPLWTAFLLATSPWLRQLIRERLGRSGNVHSFQITNGNEEDEAEPVDDSPWDL